MSQQPGGGPARNGADAGHARAADVSARDEAPGVRDFLTVLFKRRRSMLVTFFAIVITVTTGTFLMPPAYEAEAKLLVRVGRENVYRPEVGDSQEQVLAYNIEEVINSETNILTSRDLIARVVSSLTVERLYPDLAASPPRRGSAVDAAVARFGDSLGVEAVRKSNVIRIWLRHGDPRVAAASLNLLVDYFKEKHIEAYSQPQSSYLEDQLAAYEKRLTQAQDRLEAFKQSNGVFSLEEQRTLLLQQRADLDGALKTTRSQIKELQEKIASVTALLRTVSAEVPLATESERYRSIDEAKTQLLALQLKEQDLLRKFTETNQLVVSVRREMEIVRAFIAREEPEVTRRVQTGRNVVYVDLERELNRLRAELPSQEAKADSLGRQIAQLDQQIPVLDLTEMSLENLKRDVAVNDRNYRAYLEKVEDARILDELNRQKRTSISVIQEATVPAEPVSPRTLLNLALGLVLGAVAGLGIAFVRELSAQGLSTPGSAERALGLPVLATIPRKR